jgi:hypothetical protein
MYTNAARRATGSAPRLTRTRPIDGGCVFANYRAAHGSEPSII